MIVNRADCIIKCQFEDNVTNLVSGGTSGTVTGSAAYVDSTKGRAFDFDGSTYIEFGNSDLSDSSDLTVFLRMNLDTHTTGDKIFAKRTTASANGFYMTVTASATDTLRFRIRNAADSAWVTVDLVLPETNLYAIRCEINLGTEITLSAYTTAGVLTTASTAYTSGRYTSNSDNICLGDLTAGNNGMDGKIDDFTVVKKILSDEDFYRYYMGMPISDQTFMSSKVLTFDGTNESVTIPNDASIVVLKDTVFSYSLWVKTSSVSESIISNVGTDGGSPYYNAGATVKTSAAGRVQFNINYRTADGRKLEIQSSNDIDDGNWHHVVCTYDGSLDYSGMNIYIDGALESVYSFTNGNINYDLNHGKDYFFGQNGSGGSYFTGSIDDVAMFDKELSLAEASEIYNGGSLSDSNYWSMYSNVISLWNIENDSISSITDKVASNDGTPANMDASNIIDR